MQGQELRDIRTALRLSQAQLAKMLNKELKRSYDASRISKMEGSKTVPEEVAKAAAAMRDAAPQQARIIALANQKGGVGKTTSSINLAFGLSRGGKRVLLIDMDPQATASTAVLHGAVTLAHETGRTMANVLLENKPISEAIIPPGEKFGDAPVQPFAILASHINLSAADAQNDVSFPYRLVDQIDKIRTDFDFIIIDAPPNLGMLTNMSLIAATDVIVPVRTEPYDQMGVGLILGTINKIQNRPNPSLRLRGILPTQFNSRKAVDRQVVINLFQTLQMMNAAANRRKEEEVVLLPPVPDSAIFGRAAYAGAIALSTNPTKPAVDTYNKLCEWFILGEPLQSVDIATIEPQDAGEGDTRAELVGRPTMTEGRASDAQ